MNIKKTIALILLATLIVPIGFYPTKADALFGVVDIVIDPAHIATNVLGWIADAVRWLAQQALKVALENLKKRLLDSIVDNIIEWIQGGFDGSPQFLTDPGRLFTDSYQAAVGDTLRELGHGYLCDEGFSIALRAMLRPEPRPFSQTITCTLDDVVTKIDAFRDDFLHGKWIALQRSFQPQNNIFGLQFLVRNRVVKRYETEFEIAKMEAEMGQGYLPVVRCLEWTAFRRDGSEIGRYHDDSRSPTQPPDVPLPEGARWQCTKSDTTVPGSIAAAGAERATYSDLDYILSAQELAAYASAIVDALLNQLIQKGYDGLLGIFKTGDERRYGEGCDDLEGELLDACRGYSELSEREKERQEEEQRKLREQQEAASAIQSAASEARNAERAMLSLISAYRELGGKIPVLENCFFDIGVSCSLVSVIWVEGKISELEIQLEELKEFAESVRELLALPGMSPEMTKQVAEEAARRFAEVREQKQLELTETREMITKVNQEIEKCEGATVGEEYECPAF